MQSATRRADSTVPEMSARPDGVNDLMSYQARITNPLFTVTGRSGACGNTKRTGSESGKPSSSTIGTKSWPSAPRPCSSITEATAGTGGVSVISKSVSSRRYFMPAKIHCRTTWGARP